MSEPRSILEVIPAVDVLDGTVVRLLRGDYQHVTTYDADPVRTARDWMEQGAKRVHAVDLAGARSGVLDPGLWERLVAAGVRVQAGGGIRTVESARRLLDLGVERVVMGTAAVWAPETLASLGDRVVAAVDVRGDRATGAGWLDRGRDLRVVLDGLAGASTTRVLVTGIGRDGTLEGPDLDLIGSVVDDSRFAVIASGGVSSLADLSALAVLGCEAVVVGRALYEGRFTLAEAHRV